MAEDHDHRHPEFVVGIDLGAGVTRAHHLYADGEFVPMCSLEHRPIRPQSGLSELDPADVLATLAQALDYAPGAAGVAIASEAGTVVAWDAETGAPVHNALAPDDQRAGPLIAELVSQGAAALTTARAGLLPDARLPAAKFRWLLDHAPEAAALARSGRLRLGTMGSFCLDRLAGVHATDVSAASRTGLMDLATGQWDAELCRLFGVPPELLPEIRPTVADHGVLAPWQTPVVASVLDRHARLFGHGCHAPGRIAVSFDGEGEALAVAEHMPSAGTPPGVSSTVAWRIGAQATHALVAGLGSAAASVDWARGLGLYQAPRDIARFDGPSALERGLVFVPALSGLACPHQDISAAALWLGMAPDTTRPDLMRAVLEGVALRTAEVVRTLGQCLPLAASVSVDGALTRSPYFCEFLARTLERTVVVPSSPDLTGLGCAQLAFVGAGFGPVETLPPVPPPDRVVAPAPVLDAALLARFDDAVGRARGWRSSPTGGSDGIHDSTGAAAQAPSH
jgi:glycerol kinase